MLKNQENEATSDLFNIGLIYWRFVSGHYVLSVFPYIGADIRCVLKVESLNNGILLSPFGSIQ